MIIGIDLTSTPYGTGVSSYTLNLVKNLLKIDKVNIYKLFFSSFRLKPPLDIIKLSQLPNVKLYQYRLPLTLLEFIWNQLHLFPIELFIGRTDVFHTSDWTQPPTLRAKTVTTIHDLFPLTHPNWHHPKTVKVHRRKLFWAIRQCRHFICVSQSTRHDLLKLFPKIVPDRASFVYEAAEKKYNEYSRLSKKLKLSLKQIINRQYGLSRYFLIQGTREPRKNLNRIIAAFIQFKKSQANDKTELAITGKYGWGKDTAPQNPYIKILGYIPERHLVALHAAATCLVYPSLDEGFGLPIIKSMKVATPVITSHTPSLAEVSGGRALLVNPLSVSEISDAMLKITQQAPLRQKLVRAGLVWSRQFSWTKTARQTLAIYQSLC